MNLPLRARRVLSALALVVTTLSAVSACGSTGSVAATTVAPAAYWQPVAGVQRCYYVDDPTEVINLKAAGLCPAASVAYPAPLSWEDEYWAYYSSPAYYDTYMPVTRRTHYTSVTVITFAKANSAGIAKAEKTAQYVTSSGRKVTGTGSGTKFSTTAPKLSSTSGKVSSQTVHGGGSARGASSCSLAMTVIADKSGSGSGSSHGGGSARSGSSGSKSSTSKTSTSKSSGTGAHGGC